MTPGELALREAARLEAAAFYSRAVGDTSCASREARAAADDAAVEAARRGVDNSWTSAGVHAQPRVDARDRSAVTPKKRATRKRTAVHNGELSPTKRKKGHD